MESKLKELETTVHNLHLKVAELDWIKSYLESILSHIGQAILFIGMDGRMTTYNPMAEKVLGYGRDEVLYRPFWDFFDDQMFGFSVKEALKTKSSQTHPLAVVVQAKGKPKDLEVNATYVPHAPFKAPDGVECPLPKSMEGLIIILRDVTEIRRLENRALHSDKMKEMGHMASVVAHEIRNPLGGIKGFAALLSRDLADQPKLKQMADYILEGSESLNELVNQVLNYSRPLEPHFESTDLKKLLTELIAQEKVDDAFKKSKLSFECNEAVVMAPVDGELLKRAVLNLMTNAVQAMPRGGRVYLRLSTDDDQAVIQVADTGEGISPENMKKIFTPFFTTKVQGNGYGLAEVQKVVQSHGGHVEVMSKPGEGAEFTLKIPLKVSHDY